MTLESTVPSVKTAKFRFYKKVWIRLEYPHYFLPYFVQMVDLLNWRMIEVPMRVRYIRLFLMNSLFRASSASLYGSSAEIFISLFRCWVLFFPNKRLTARNQRIISLWIFIEIALRSLDFAAYTNSLKSIYFTLNIEAVSFDDSFSQFSGKQIFTVMQFDCWFCLASVPGIDNIRNVWFLQSLNVGNRSRCLEFDLSPAGEANGSKYVSGALWSQHFMLHDSMRSR